MRAMTRYTLWLKPKKLAAGIAGAEMAVSETASHLPIPGLQIWKLFRATLFDFLNEPG